jgi:type IV pilus assembly protein PilE
MRSSLGSVVYAARNTLQSRLQGPGRGPRSMGGVTLIELLTVMVVLSILTTIAVGSYRRYLIRTNRTDATATLLRVQVAQEKFYLQNNTYTANLVQLGMGAKSGNEYYDISIAAPAGGDLTTGYVAAADAAKGQKTDDKDCQRLTIDDRGRRGASPAAADLCWR